MTHQWYFVFRMGATVFVQPLDLVKNRMQMSGEKQLIFEQAISKLPLASFSKQVLVLTFSYKN